MSAPKVGDRVRVEFEGVIVEIHKEMPGGYWFVLRDEHQNEQTVQPDWCTVITPPIKVGDLVTSENIGQLGERAIVAPDGGAWNGYYKRSGKWYEMCDGEVVEANPEYIARSFDDMRVLRVGGGS